MVRTDVSQLPSGYALARGVLREPHEGENPLNHAAWALDRFRVFTELLRTSVLVAGACLLIGCGSDSDLFRGSPDVQGEAGAEAEGAGGAPEASGGASAGGAPSEPPVDDGQLFDPDHILQVEITLTPADWDTIRVQTRGLSDLLDADCQSQPFPSPFSYVPADVTIDGETRSNVGLRKKGFLGSLDDNKAVTQALDRRVRR